MFEYSCDSSGRKVVLEPHSMGITSMFIPCNLVSRAFLRHTLMTKKPNEHPGTLRSNAPRKWMH